MSANIGNSGFGYLELLRQLLKKNSICAHYADFFDVFIGEFGVVMSFAFWTLKVTPSVSDCIEIVLSARVPSKIIDPVIDRIAVAMASLKSWWARPDKCLKNENVNEYPAPWITERDGEILAFVAGSNRPHIYALKFPHCVVSARERLSVKASNASFVRNLVSKMTGDVFPDFHVHFKNVRKSNYTSKVTH